MHIFGGGNPIYKADKTTLKQQLNDEKEEKKKTKSEMENQDTYLFWVELCCFRLSSSHF